MRRLAITLLAAGLLISPASGAVTPAPLANDSLAAALEYAPHTDRVIVRLKGGEQGTSGRAVTSRPLFEQAAAIAENAASAFQSMPLLRGQAFMCTAKRMLVSRRVSRLAIATVPSR